jgi:hypothetical protein
MVKHRYSSGGDVSLSSLPKWFIERENSFDLIGLVYRKDEHIRQDDVEKCFESVFVVCEKFEDEVDDKKVDVAEFKGFDTSAELCDHLAELQGKEVEFIYNTKKHSYYEYSIEAIIAEMKPEPETEKGKGSHDTQKTPAWAAGLPTVQKGASPGPLETRPGDVGPKRT